MTKKIIKGATIITQDDVLGVLPKGDILIEDSKISSIAPDIGNIDGEVIDGTDMIAIPGFVDAHRHNWESLLRSVGVDWTLTQYFTAVKKIMGPMYTADDIYLANYLGALECLDCGITTLFDWFHNNNSPEHADGAVKGLADAGIRAVLGYSNSIYGELPVSSIPMDYDDLKRVKNQYFSSEDQLLTLSLATRGPQFLDMNLAVEELKLAKELDIFTVMHVGDGSWGMSRPINKLDDLNLLNDSFTFIHCNTLHDDEIEIIGKIGANAVCCPEVELNMGHGYPSALRLMKVNVKPALGIDVCTSIPGDMFGSMRSMLAGVRSVVNDAALKDGNPVEVLPLFATDVFSFATRNGASACKLENKVGSLAPGKEADIVLIDTNSPNMFPVNNPIGVVVEAAHAGNVDTVLVAGKVVKRNKRLLDIDIAAIRRKVDNARDRLFTKAGIPVTGEWIPEIYAEKPPM